MTPNPPPELTNYAANAYNAKDGNFLSKPVFALTYNQGHKVDWGPKREKRDIPDQIRASVATTHYEVDSSLLMESKADYDRSFSASLDAEFSGVAFSASAQSSLLYHGGLFSSTSSFYSLNFYLQSILAFERKDLKLDAEFITAITSLPKNIATTEGQQKYFDFFNAYGTHYASSATMGGTIVMETDIKDSVLETSSLLDVSVGVSAGYQGVVRSGSVSVNAAYSSSTFLSQHKNEVMVSLNIMGGLPSEQISAWATSLYGAPSLLFSVPTLKNTRLTNLEVISKLVAPAGGDPAIAQNINSLLHNYVTEPTYKDGLLSSPKNVSFGEVFDSKTGDGFLVALIEETANGNRGYIQAFDNKDPNPTTIRAAASQHYYTDHDKWVTSASLTMPAPHGTSFLATSTPTNGNSHTALRFIGMGNIGDEAMGPWQDIALNSDLTAPSDGFVVAYVDWNGRNGARGFIQGEQKLENGDFTVVAGASQHVYSDHDTWIPTNSFCMTIRKNTPYRVNLTVTSQGSVAKGFFVPLSEALVLFDSFQSRSENITYQAQTDGFLIAYLFTNTNGDRGYVDLFTHPDGGELRKLGKLATTSIHYFRKSDIQVPYNTAMIPVPKGDFYSASFTRTAGSPGIQLLWMPLGIKQT